MEVAADCAALAFLVYHEKRLPDQLSASWYSILSKKDKSVPQVIPIQLGDSI